MQLAFFPRLHVRGFGNRLAFPMYANYIGIRKERCAALLRPHHVRRLQYLRHARIPNRRQL